MLGMGCMEYGLCWNLHKNPLLSILGTHLWKSHVIAALVSEQKLCSEQCFKSH
jgi:hypothetical protein